MFCVYYTICNEKSKGVLERAGDIPSPYVLSLRRLGDRRLRRIQHIFNENAVARGGVVDENMGHSPHELAVLDNRRAAQECGQVGTTLFINSFVSLGIAS